MDVFTSEVLPFTRNPIWNDALLFFGVAVYVLLQVLIFVGGVFINRHLNILYIGYGVITSSEDSVCHVKSDKSIHSVKDTNMSMLKECTETNDPRSFPSRHGPKEEMKHHPALTDLGSNLRHMNNMNVTTNYSLKIKPPDSCLQDTHNKLEKGSTLKVLFVEQFRPAESTITVYPARQHQEHTHSPGNYTDSSETTNVTLGEEGEENSKTDGSLQRTAGDSTETSDPRPVISSDIANQMTEKRTVPRQDDPRSDEISPEQAPEDGSSELLGIVAQSRYEYPAYELLAERRQTYRRYPYRLQQKEISLSNAGFFFTGTRDCTRCFCCGGGLEHWDTEDDPWVEHARWFPNCSFVIRNKKQCFVDRVQHTLRHSRNECELTPHQQRQVSRQQNSELQQRQQCNSFTETDGSDRTRVPRVSSNDLAGNNVVGDRVDFPRYPEYDNLTSRSITFLGTYDPQLAEAGFFWQDHGLLVCYYCGGHLYAWKPGDDLWTNHAQWFPNCQYLKAKRGQSFITNVQSEIEKLVNVEMTNTTFSQYPQRISQQTCRQNNLETSNPQSPTVPRHISQQVRPLDSADKTNEGPSEAHAQLQPIPSVVHAHPQPRPCVVQNHHQQRPCVVQTQHQPIPSVAQTQHQPRPSVVQTQHQLTPSVVHTQHQLTNSVVQTQHQPIPSVALTQHQPIPSVAQTQHQPRPSVVQTQHQLTPSVVQTQYQPIPSGALTQHQPIPSLAQTQLQPRPFMIQAQEDQICLSQSVTVEENGHINPLRPNIISNRNTEQVHSHRTVYAPRVTRSTQTGQVVQGYPWDLLCRICQESAAVVTFVPCGHVVCCRRCGRLERVCPVCHRSIDGIEQG